MYQKSYPQEARRGNRVNSETDLLIPKKSGRLTELDGVRGWAVFIVFMFHFALSTHSYFGPQEQWGTLLRVTNSVMRYTPFLGSTGGNFGVEIFFVLSGFLIYLSLKRKRPSFGKFIANRFSRLLPANLVILLQSLTVASPIAMVLNIFFLSYFYPSVATINFVTWAVSYEILFYFICAVWFIFGRRFSFLSSWMFFFLFSLLIIITSPAFTSILATIGIKYIEVDRFIAFFFGLALGKLYLGKKSHLFLAGRFFSRTIIPALVGVCFVKILWDGSFYSFFGDYSRSAQYFFFDVFIFVVLGYMLTRSGSILHAIFNFLPLRTLGTISYSFYLSHAIWGIPIGAVLADSLMAGGGSAKILVYFAASFASTFAIALFMYQYLEKPYFKPA